MDSNELIANYFSSLCTFTAKEMRNEKSLQSHVHVSTLYIKLCTQKCLRINKICVMCAYFVHKINRSLPAWELYHQPSNHQKTMHSHTL